MTVAVDFSAREGHFVDHLFPVWRELEPTLRGTFFTSAASAPRARGLGISPVVEGWPRRSPRTSPVVVASWGDLKVAHRTRRPIVLLEHGAGQTYGNRHSSYAGGRGRENVKLFLVPGPHPAGRNRRTYPSTPNVEIGSPRVDELAKIPRSIAGPAAAISFHWRCEVVRETYTALDHYAPLLAEVRAALELEGVELLGHAHPRIADEASAIYRGAGIEFVETFEEVVARADLYACDNSSTLFEFAALGRPVVVLNAPHFRRDVHHGLRFWTEADVGLNVDGPEELAPAVLKALEDPPELAEVREAALDRIYPVRDGSSALRAAIAVEDLVRGDPGACLVCGASSCSCGGPTEIVPIDQRVRSRGPVGRLKRYPNPAREGAFLRLSDEDARRMGLAGQAVEDRPRRPRPPDVTNEGASGPLTSSKTAEKTAEKAEEPSSSSDVPEGALRPGGPTSRARAKAQETEETEEDDVNDEDAEPKDKKRPAPSSRRRRKTTSSSSTESSSTKKKTSSSSSTKKDA